MNDGAVIFNTRLNNKQLEIDYAKAVKKIEELEGKINIKTGTRNALAEQAANLGAKLDKAKAKLYEMQSAAKGAFSTDEIKAQQEMVNFLQHEWDALQRKVEGYDRQIASAEEKLQEQKDYAARLANEIEMAAKNEKKLKKEAGPASKSLGELGKRLAGLASGALVFSAITQGFTLARNWLGDVIKQNDQTAASLARLKGALLTMAQPILNVVIPVFTALINLLTAVIGKIAAFLSMLGGKTVEESAAAAEALRNQGEAYGDVADAAKEAKKQLMGFDELNKLEDTSASTGGNGNDSGEIIPDFSWSGGVTETMEKLAGWVLAIAAGLALWKISSYLPGTLGMIVGTIGKLLAGVGLVAAGFILLKEAFQDASENGMNLENTLKMVAGIILTGMGISVLAGSWIPLLVAGILGLLVALTSLTGNGGAMIEGLKQTFGGLLDFITGVFTGDWDKAWDGLVNAGRGAVNVLISILNSLIDLAVAGLNLIQIDIPDWVPIIGGRYFGINIQNPPQIPYLAQGAVIPPNREFMAVLGDQKHGTNIEAPEDLIRKIVREETASLGGSDRLVQLMEILIDTVEGIEVGDETIGKAAARYNRSTARARGT